MSALPMPRGAAPGDAEIVGRVVAGDREAYGELVRRYQAAIYRHVRGMGLDHDTALDLVQDAFVRAYARIASCQDRTHFRAWLYRIARNQCLDHLKNVRRNTIPFSRVPGVDAIPAGRASASETNVNVRDALARLPEPLREAFLLKHDAGYTYDEIAAMIGATPSAAKMRVHRAREALLDMLEPPRDERLVEDAKVAAAAAAQRASRRYR